MTTRTIDELIKNHVYGFACGACDTGGSDGGQGDCKNCNGYGIVDWRTTELTQDLLATIKAGLPEKYTQTEMMAGIDDSADYRDGYNQALKAVEDYLDSLFSKGEDV